MTTVVQEESKTEVKQEPPKPKATKIPTLSPYLAPAVMCSNRDCRRIMHPSTVTDKGGEVMLRYDCVPCNYSFFASMVHAQGQCKPLGSDRANPPEVLQKGR